MYWKNKPLLAGYRTLDLSCGYEQEFFFKILLVQGYASRYPIKVSLYYRLCIHDFFWFIANLPVIKKPTNMHSGYAHQHLRLCASEKKHKVTCKKIEPQFFTKLKNFAHYSTSCL